MAATSELEYISDTGFDEVRTDPLVDGKAQADSDMNVFCSKVYTRLSQTFQAGTTRPLEYRRQQLKQLIRLLQENAPAFEEALLHDLGKPRQEIDTEMSATVDHYFFQLKYLDEWAQPTKPREVEDWRSGWNPTVYKQPKGLSLIIGPWNYPVVLLLGPLAGAIAAGCTCVVKGSELVPAMGTLLAALLPKYLDPTAYAYVNGGVRETTRMLEKRWAHIFFTGSERTGRVVAEAAAKHVTPVTLELGGKSPVIIAEDTDIELAAKRVLYGKAQNSGQLCVSPDHVYVPRAKQDAFVAALLRVYKTFWPEGPFHEGSHWGNIINPAHHARIRGLLSRTKGDIVIGGYFDGEKRIAPTIVNNVRMDDSLMEEELFAPILPIIPVQNVDEAIEIIRGRPKPLVLYLFSNNPDVKQTVMERTESGALTLNDTYSHLAGAYSPANDLHSWIDRFLWTALENPFGGIGSSGYGSWAGKASFDTFTHHRGYVDVPFVEEPMMEFRYPPYTDEKRVIVSRPLRAKI
ncbi:uncharacterized protein FIBRA_03238 [Fibroporia radiculosa]|uniref:Aldehyde dehydrogenase n=1 Tax=Fibroporia radiculosa TaxID=599839 RepID=J4GND3_9APHY|nr:uncharacterized protein FIBRA_03238 [Fibroporia radiculosa]CCM01190.1 predicted protein [Fibroporia radiculosa]